MLVEVLAVFGIITMSIVSYLVLHLPIKGKTRSCISASGFFSVIAWIFLYIYLETGHGTYILSFTASFIISTFFGALGGSEISKFSRVIKPTLSEEERSVFKRQVILAETHFEFINRLLELMIQVCDVEAIKNVFDKCVEDHPILQESWSQDNRIKLDVLTENLEGMSEEESELRSIRAFSALVSGLVDFLESITSFSTAEKLIRKTMNAMNVGEEYHAKYEQELLLGLPEGIAEKEKVQATTYLLFNQIVNPLLEKCNPKTVEKLQPELERKAKENPYFKGVNISSDGTLDVKKLCEELSEMETEEDMKQTIRIFSTILDECYSIASEDIGKEPVDSILSERFTGLLDKHGEFLVHHGVIDAIPKDIAPYSKAKLISFTLLKDILNPLLKQCRSETIKIIRNQLKNSVDSKPILTGVKISKSGVNLSKICTNMVNLSDEDSAKRAISTTTAVMEVCLPVIQKDLGLKPVKKTTENAFQSIVSSDVIKDPELVRTLSKIIEVLPRGVLEEEKLSLLSRRELERRVRKRTAELREAYEKLKELDQMKDEFIMMSAHELKTPLTLMRGNVNLLLSGSLGELSKDQREVLEEIRKAVNRQEISVEKFLDASRIESGKLVLEKSRFNPDELVNKIVESERKLAMSEKTEIKTDLAKVSEIEGDQDRIETVLRELIENAKKYSSPDSKVTVGIKELDKEVLFWVKDNGKGIPPEHYEEIFEKFSQVDHSEEGSGLGLNICKNLVEAHNGDIWFESELGEGSTFYFSIPK